MKTFLLALFTKERNLKQSVFGFLYMILCSQLIYGIRALKDVAFAQLAQMWTISAAQLGALFSLSFLVGISSCFFLSWLHDRLSIRFILATGLIATGVANILLVFASQYWQLLILFGMLGLLTEGYIGPAVLGSARELSRKKAQGRVFGVMEFFRGLIELLQNGLVLGLLFLLNQSFGALRTAMLFNSGLMFPLALLLWKFYPCSGQINKNPNLISSKKAIQGLFVVLRLPEIWLLGLSGASIYAAYAAIPYFPLFLRHQYSVSLAFASLFALLNTSFTRLAIAPFAGLSSDRLFRGATNAMMAGLAIMAVVLLGILAKSQSLPFALAMLLLCTIIIYFLRPLYFVPISEMNMPPEISGSATAIVSMLIYSPGAWGYALYGYIIERYDGAYKKIFAIYATMGNDWVNLYQPASIPNETQKKNFRTELKFDPGSESGGAVAAQGNRVRFRDNLCAPPSCPFPKDPFLNQSAPTGGPAYTRA